MMKNNITLGVSGDVGSFSEEAAHIYAKKMGITPELIYLIDMENVLAAVEMKKVDIGIFPVVNLRGGLVKMAFSSMGKHLFTVIDEVWLDVCQCLLAKPGTQTEQIKKIVSHPQAIAQCSLYLKKEFAQAELIEWEDTAKAAKDLSQGKLDNSYAVIAPEPAARIYELDIMKKSIQDIRPNLTAFIVVKSIDNANH